MPESAESLLLELLLLDPLLELLLLDELELLDPLPAFLGSSFLSSLSFLSSMPPTFPPPASFCVAASLPIAAGCAAAAGAAAAGAAATGAAPPATAAFCSGSRKLSGFLKKFGAVVPAGGVGAADAFTCCSGALGTASVSLSTVLASVSSSSALRVLVRSFPTAGVAADGCAGTDAAGTDAHCCPPAAAFADGAVVCLLAAGLAACTGFSAGRAVSACGVLVLGGAFEAAPNENMDPAPVLGLLAGAGAAGGFVVQPGGAAGS